MMGRGPPGPRPSLDHFAATLKNGSACGPVIVPVFKTDECCLTAALMGSTPIRFRQLYFAKQQLNTLGAIHILARYFRPNFHIFLGSLLRILGQSDRRNKYARAPLIHGSICFPQQ